MRWCEGHARDHSANVGALIVLAMAATAAVLVGDGVRAREQSDCRSAGHCRQLALDAIAQRDYERAHDLAWRLVQTSPPRDPAAMSLLARAQSLSGRGYDALIMLERLAAAEVIVADADTSDDFRRVREYPQWPQLLESMTRLRAKSAQPAASPSAPSALRRAESSAPKPIAPASASSGAAADKPVEAATLLAPPGRSAPPAPLAPLAPVFTLSLPTSTPVPVAFAHDAVSARFVTVGEASDVLHVVSETSGTATDLNSPGWSGNSRVTALAIAPRTGDLWVAGALEGRATLHRLQLISGRLLQTVTFPENAGEVHVAAIVVSPDAVFALDSAGRRIFGRGAKTGEVRVQAELPREITPTGLAYAGSALFVSHAAGVLRIDLAARSQRAVAVPKGITVHNLRSLSWHGGSLLAVQGADQGATVVRVRLNPAGTAVTRVDRLGQASSTAAVLSGQTYFYLGDNKDQTTLAFHGIPAQR